MKKLYSLIFILVLTALMSVDSFATYSSMEFIGFSKDGKYLAFENTNYGGDAGGGSKTTYFVDTVKNSYVISPVVLPNDDDNQPARYKIAAQLYSQKVSAAIGKFGIVRRNTGSLVVNHLLSDWSNVTPVQNKRSFYENGESKDAVVTDYYGSVVRRKGSVEKIIFNGSFDAYRQNTYEFYELTLTSTPISGQVEEEGSNLRMELTLQDKTVHPFPELQVLQRDGPVPPNQRRFAYGYKVESVYIYDNKIAVFINVFGQGFEETDMDYMVVTGLLKP